MDEKTNSEKLARIEVLLSDACGGAATGEPNRTGWDALRFAEHVLERQAAIVLVLEDTRPLAAGTEADPRCLDREWRCAREIEAKA